MKSALTLSLIICASIALASPSGFSSLAFKAGSSNEFTFDTGVLKGSLRADGKSKGFSAVEHVPTGARLDSSMALFSHYRIFSANKRYGDAAWNWPSTARLNPDGSVSVVWPGTEDRPFELGATYRYVAPDTIELETTFRPQSDLKGIEVFLASYFGPTFTNASIWMACPGGKGSNALTPALKEHGDWLCYPRDAAGLELIRDGRWTCPPSPVEWSHMGDYVQPLAVRRSVTQGVTVLVMASSQDCYSVLAPYGTESHRSLYLALFGRDGKAGETLKAKSRLVVITDMTDHAAIKIWKKAYK